MFWMLLGVVDIAIGLHIFRNPDSDWYRWLHRIPEDFEREDVELAKTRIGGVTNICIGSMIFLTGLFAMFKRADHSFFFVGVLCGSGLVALGLHAIKRPDSGGFRRREEVGEPSDLRIWYIKFAGKVTIAFGVIVILLGAQFLFV